MKRTPFFINLVWRVMLFAFFCVGSWAGGAEVLEVMYPATDSNDPRASYYADVLKLVLDKSEVPYTLEGKRVQMSHLRKVKTVVNGELSVIWCSNLSEIDEHLEPVRIPICGGLLGYRVFMVHQDTLPALAMMQDLKALRSFQIGQGIGWSDTDVLEHAGFSVDVAPYDSLFKMLNADRFALFGRGVHEAHAEVEARQSEFPALTVAPSIGLHYPLIRFFYVRKTDEQLKKALAIGLKRAHADGSFKAFFRNHPLVKPVLDRGDLQSRHWLELENPFLSEEDLESAQKYFDPGLLGLSR
jgi:hypothetical protein